MKKLFLAFLATATLTFAGGDIAPTEPESPILEVQVKNPYNFYVGLGAMYVYQNEDTDDRTALGGTGIIGYSINDNIAVEYRGTITDGPFSRQGVYLKVGGTLPIGVETSKVNVYALGGYSQTYFRDTDSQESGEVGVGIEIKDVLLGVDVFVDGLYVLRTDRIVPLAGVKYNF